jgi:hypothetical protein
VAKKLLAATSTSLPSTPIASRISVWCRVDGDGMVGTDVGGEALLELTAHPA